MTETSERLSPESLKDLRNVTFSQALVVGLSHSDCLVGRKTEKCGRDLALASHSVLRGKAEELRTRDTYGPLFDGLLPKNSLQSCLESRLRVRLEGRGSPEYVLTWKQWDMELGVPICALRASGVRKSGKGYGGWATPRANKTTDEKLESWQKRKDKGDVATMPLTLQAQMAGWPTASTRDWKDTPGMSTTGVNPDGSKRTRLDQLPRVAGLVQPGTNAGTGSKDAFRLNPRFSLWLQGFPIEWAYCGERVTRLARKSRKSS